MAVEKYGWAIQKRLFAQTNQDSTFSHTCKISKMLNTNTTSKYFSFLTKNHLQAESCIQQGIFLHVIPVRIIVLCLQESRDTKVCKLMLNKNFLFIRTCRPYVEVLPDGFCKDYIPNQFIAQDNKTAESTDIHIRRGIDLLKDFFLIRKLAPRHKILQGFNNTITSKH